MATVYSYLRCSDKKQVRGDTERRQRENGEKWIARTGHTFAKEYPDLGVSSFRGKNRHTGQLSKFLEHIEIGRVKPGSILLVENLDRLSREGMRKAKDLFEKILEAGVDIVTLMPSERHYTASTTLSDPMGLMEPLWAFWLAGQESEKKSNRLKEVWHARRLGKSEMGGRWQRCCPSWIDYDAEQDKFKLNDGVKAVRFIFEQTANGVGQRALVRLLNKKFPAIGRSGKWMPSYVQRVLRDRCVIGEYQPMMFDPDHKRVPAGEAIKGYYPPAITEELFYRAQSAKANKRLMKGRSSNFVNLFTGRLFNAHDGHPLHITNTPSSTGRVRRRLVSEGHLNGRKGADPVGVEYDTFAAAIMAALKEMRWDHLTPRGSADAVRKKQQEVSGLEQRLAEIEADMTDPANDYRFLMKISKEVTAKRDQAIKELEVLKIDLNADPPLDHLKEAYRLLQLHQTDEDKHRLQTRIRSLVAELVERIDVKPEAHYGRVWVTAQVKFRAAADQTQPTRYVMYGPNLDFIATHAPEEVPQDVDLFFSNPDFLILEAKAKEYVKPKPAPKYDRIPDTLGDAANLFLELRRSELARKSYSTIPTKVKTFVSFLGADLPCKNLTGHRWEQWTTHVMSERKAERFNQEKARVYWSRSREFVRWMIEHKACPPITELDQSGLAMFK